MMSRQEKVATIKRLRARGLTVPQIGEQLRLRPGTVRGLLSDPDGSKQRHRRLRYQGTCRICGGPTDGSNGRAAAPEFCRFCFPKEHRIWTRETIIAAIQQWTEEHGQPPTPHEWLHSRDGHPGFTSIYGPNSPFLRWADAIEAAGYRRPRVGLDRAQTDWTPELILAWLRNWAQEHGRSPRSTDTLGSSGPSQGTVRARFGSWNQALLAAGLELNSATTKQWTKERIEAAIQEWVAEHGRPPTVKEWQVPGQRYPWPRTLARAYGSWSAAITAAGFPKPRRESRPQRRSPEPTPEDAPEGQRRRLEALARLRNY